MKKALVLICIAGLILSICACSAIKNENTKDIPLNKKLDLLIEKGVRDAQQETFDSSEIFEEAHKVLGVRQGNLERKDKDACYTVYFVVLYGVYSKTGDKFEEKTAGFNPAAIVLKKDNEQYSLVEYWVPRDGDYYNEDLKTVFPSDIYESLQDMEKTAESHNEVVAELEKEIRQKLANLEKK